MKRKHDPYLRVQPWKVLAVFQPIESIIHRLKMDGTVEVEGAEVVFTETSTGHRYNMIEALRGVIEFFDIATGRYGIQFPTFSMTRFANKLDLCAPIFEDELGPLLSEVDECKRLAMGLRVSQAEDVLKTVKISEQMDRLKAAA